MISFDDQNPPPDPSSSNHHQQICHDLKVSDSDLKSPDADIDLDDSNNQLPNFSIRDYAFGLRSKDIACNWPFSSKSLQLCLKHRVKNVLPPFQSIDSLRNNSYLTKCNLENSLTNKDIIENSSGLKEQLTHTKSKEKKPHASSQNTKNASQKSTRFIMKLNSGIERVDSVAPNSFIVTETMASKICPVCKIFSSSSNTTLNAHIDQCLMGEGTMKWTENPKVVIVKSRVKPRKTRLMVDIYQTAPHCTVEELDIRNGTNWATNSSFPDHELGEEDDNKKSKSKMKTIDPGVPDNEGDVYIDTNGTKVRILSGLSGNHGAPKLIKGIKGCKIIMGKKKRNIYKQNNHHKYVKVNSNDRKLSSSKPQARSGENAENCSKDERGKGIMKVGDSGIIIRPPWACSKRTGLLKKFSDKNRNVELKCHETKKDLFVESDKYSSSSSSLQINKKTSDRMMEFGNDDECEGAENQSNGSKLSSCSKNRTFRPAKFNLKRKFNENYVDVPSQDSSKEQSRMEEHIRSITSNGESSVGIQIVNWDELRDVESSRNEQVCVVAPSSFISLSNFDQELYQDQICSTNQTPIDVEKHENYSQEVDPIPIPGPPGSFLPSPGGEMVSEDQLPSSENHHDHHDSMSNSPVSNVSHPSLARSDSRSTSVQDVTYKNPFFNGETGFTETGFSQNNFKNNQPCCCSRKEVALNYQDSFILKKQPIESSNTSTPTSLAPVLRLMGKNLTVVKTDEEASLSSQLFRPPILSQQHGQRPAVFSPYRNRFEPQHFNVHQPVNMRSHFDVKSVHDGFMASESLDRYGHRVSYLGPTGPHVRSTHDHNVLKFQEDVNPLYTMFPSQGLPHPYRGGSLVFRGGGFQTSLGNGVHGIRNIGSSSSQSPSTSYYISS